MSLLLVTRKYIRVELTFGVPWDRVGVDKLADHVGVVLTGIQCKTKFIAGAYHVRSYK